MRRRSALFFLPLLAFACGAPNDDLGPTAQSLESIIATCSKKSGDVQLKRNGEGFWSQAEVASVFRAGDWVKTGTDATARVELLSGGALELDSNASIVLEENPQAGPEKAPVVAVQEGAVKGSLGLNDFAGIELKMSDGSKAHLKKSGTAPVEFRVSKSESGTDVQLNNGEATLDTGSEQKVLKLGVVASVTKAGVRETRLLDPPSSFQAPAPESREPLGANVAVRWAPVPGARGYRVQLARDPHFGDDAETDETKGPSLERALTSHGAYYVRVASVDSEGRAGSYGRVMRIFAVDDPGDEHLVKPDDRATYAYVDSPPRLSFAWKPAPDGGKYKLVIASGPDLYNQRINTKSVDDPNAVLEGMAQGQYYWGVYKEDGDEPLFVRPRRLSVVKNAHAVLKAPKRINKWGK